MSRESRGLEEKKKECKKKKKEIVCEGSRGEMWEETKTDKIRRLEKLQLASNRGGKTNSADMSRKSQKTKG